VITEDFRFEGFDATAFKRLVQLLGGNTSSAEQMPGLLVIVLDAEHRPCAALVTGRGPVDVGTFEGPAQLAELCARLNVLGAVLIEDGALTELVENAADAMRFDEDYVQHWLSMVKATRALEDDGRILWWPRRTHLPIPTPAMLTRAVDLILPPRRSLVLALWEGESLWTGCAIERSDKDLCRMVGPDFLIEWAGPLAGDFRRDHRALSRAVSTAMAPVHLGLFAQREAFQSLLRSAAPGAWAQAVALREIIVSPAAPYVHVALGADALRAAGKRTAAAFGGVDLTSYFAPIAALARQRIGRVSSLTNILGFNPLSALASRLRRSAAPPSDES
jgi:hypothetical protein